MNFLSKLRSDHQELANVLNKHKGIRKIVEEAYPDQAHFLYELLQNAEDTKANAVRFDLTKDCLIFEHDGRLFNEADVKGITDIGEGTKESDADQIGRFGVGFKAVFAYSETPSVFCATYSFMIENLVLPKEIDPLPDLHGRTRFEFPFNNPKKKPSLAFEQIKEGLIGLSETSLLFLTNLESINWTIENGDTGEVLRFEHSSHHFEILHQSNGKSTRSCHFLRFDEQLHDLPSQNVSVAYPLQFLADRTSFEVSDPVEKQMRIVPAEIGQVSVFFPAEKESSGLRFHLHAPFVPELSRASVKETPANMPLFEQLAQLGARSLHDIRDLGLLNAEMLGVLPNKQDQIPKRYVGIRDAIINELNAEPLTPTQSRSHAPASTLFQGKASIKAVISDDDLAVLLDNDGPIKWAASAPQKNSNADRMLSSLAIREWDIDDLVDSLDELETVYSWQTPNLKLREWLEAKPNEWLQSLYSLLHRELGQEAGFYGLENCPIVKLEDGSFAKGKGSYFPSDGTADDGFPRVDPAVYQVGKSKIHQHAARKFLEEIGVREVDETELVKTILEDRYTKGSIDPRPGDIHRFMKLVDAEPSAAKIFRDYFIFEISDGHWSKPGSVFLDSPFLETGLRSFYGADCESEPYALAERYAEERISRSRFAKFAVAVGAKSQLEITQTNCYSNPNWPYLRAVGGERNTSPINQDYKLKGFDQAVMPPNLGVSKLIWATVDSKTFSSRYLWAIYRKNASSGSRKAPSLLVHKLKTSAWVPQRDGTFVKPADARADQLPSGFPFDVGKEWLKAVEFGAEAEKRTEEARKRKAFAAELGFEDDTALSDAQWFAGLNADERRSFKEEMESRARFEMPDHQPTNPDRRAGKVKEQAAADPEKESEKRTRSVPVGLNDVKEEADQYLRRLYTNHNGEMICQACKAPLPFKLGDGRFYVEKVELIKSLTKRHHQNYLALCPNHAAMYQHVHGSADMISDLLRQCEGGYLEVILAGEDETLYFTETHLADIRAIIDDEE